MESKSLLFTRSQFDALHVLIRDEVVGKEFAHVDHARTAAVVRMLKTRLMERRTAQGFAGTGRIHAAEQADHIAPRGLGAGMLEPTEQPFHMARPVEPAQEEHSKKASASHP